MLDNLIDCRTREDAKLADVVLEPAWHGGKAARRDGDDVWDTLDLSSVLVGEAARVADNLSFPVVLTLFDAGSSPSVRDGGRVVGARAAAAAAARLAQKAAEASGDDLAAAARLAQKAAEASGDDLAAAARLAQKAVEASGDDLAAALIGRAAGLLEARARMDGSS